MARSPRATMTMRSLPPVAKGRVHKGESGDRGGIGPHHPGPKRNGEDERLCKQRGALLALESALGPDQHGERPRGSRFQRRKRRSDAGRLHRRRSAAGARPSRQAAAASFSGSITSGTRKMPHCSAASTALASRRAGLDPLGHGAARDDRAERARAQLGRFLRHIIEARALQRREQIMQIGALFLRARLVRDAGLTRAFLADGAKLGAATRRPGR